MPELIVEKRANFVIAEMPRSDGSEKTKGTAEGISEDLDAIRYQVKEFSSKYPHLDQFFNRLREALGY